ncbi:MAG TPA: hypothetical protein V6D29_02400 [Leptolyngbyaceae cyanobacterium]
MRRLIGVQLLGVQPLPLEHPGIQATEGSRSNPDAEVVGPTSNNGVEPHYHFSHRPAPQSQPLGLELGLNRRNGLAARFSE